MEFVGLLVLWLVCAIVTAVIAGSRNRDATGWFFIGLVLGIFGIILVAAMPAIPPRTALAGKEPTTGMWICGKCGVVHHPVHKVCTKCGAPQSTRVKDTKKCPMCAEEIKIDAKKCRFCGTMLDETKEAPSA